MNGETPSELLQQLIEACKEGGNGAIRLAEQTDIASLRNFLHESAQQYRRAADDICSACHYDTTAPAGDARADEDFCAAIDDDIVASWERTECVALTYFRDAFDAALPPPIADTVKRHYEAGVTRLERLRKLQSRRGWGMGGPRRRPG